MDREYLIDRNIVGFVKLEESEDDYICCVDCAVEDNNVEPDLSGLVGLGLPNFDNVSDEFGPIISRDYDFFVKHTNRELVHFYELSNHDCSECGSFIDVDV